MHKISLTPLANALTALSQSIAVTQEIVNDRKTTKAHRETLQAGVIQHFEFCYELCFKMLKRQLEQESTSPELINTMSFQELIREGAVKGYIADAKKWLNYRHDRNLTSHTYNIEIAKKVYQTAVLFYNDALDLLHQLQEKNQ